MDHNLSSTSSLSSSSSDSSETYDSQAKYNTRELKVKFSDTKIDHEENKPEKSLDSLETLQKKVEEIEKARTDEMIELSNKKMKSFEECIKTTINNKLYKIKDKTIKISNLSTSDKLTFDEYKTVFNDIKNEYGDNVNIKFKSYPVIGIRWTLKLYIPKKE
jgi:hypothetical protein